MKNAWIVVVLMMGCSKPGDEAKGKTSKCYAKGEDAPAGDVVHKIAVAESMEVIPASKAIERFKESAEDMQAPDGCRWIHLKGAVTNKGKAEKSIKSISVYVVDGAGKKYAISTDTPWFVESDLLPTSISIAPAATAQWEAYFPVPKGATKLSFLGTDLQFVPDVTVTVDLGM